MQVDAKGNVYVADRGNARIQVFDNNLMLRAIYDHVGNPWTLCISPGPHQYLYSSNSYPDNNNAASCAITGEVYKMELDGTVIGKFGKAGKQLGEFSTIHGMDCRNENEMWVSEITAWRVQKIVLHAGGTAAARAHLHVGSALRGMIHETHSSRLHSPRLLVARCRPRRSSAQQQAFGGAQLAVPEIPFDSAPNFMKMPDKHATSARWRAWRPTRRATSSSTRAPARPTPRSAARASSRTAARACSSSIRTAPTSARSASASTASSSRTSSASTRRTTSGSSTKRRTS